jgi:hypothetical protein
MKTVKKQVYLQLEKVQVFGVASFDCNPEVRYTFSAKDYIPNPERMEFYTEIEEPESLREFLKEKGIKKECLVSWLNKNYR